MQIFSDKHYSTVKGTVLHHESTVESADVEEMGMQRAVCKLHLDSELTKAGHP